MSDYINSCCFITKLLLKLGSLEQKQLWSQIFCRLGIWEWLHWVVLAPGSLIKSLSSCHLGLVPQASEKVKAKSSASKRAHSHGWRQEASVSGCLLVGSSTIPHHVGLSKISWVSLNNGMCLPPEQVIQEQGGEHRFPWHRLGSLMCFHCHYILLVRIKLLNPALT